MAEPPLLTDNARSTNLRTITTRVYGALGSFNNLLLIPLFTVMVLETSTGVDARRVVSFDLVNLGFCACFALEWMLGLLLAENRKAYLLSFEKALDGISSVPFGFLFQGLRIARLVRVLRVVRLLVRARRFRGKGTKMLRVAGVVGATVFAGAMALRIVEPDTGDSLMDALWWSLITVSTVGYGDIVPLTDTGRIVAAVLVFFGIGVFGYVAGFMSSLMEDPDEDEILSAVRRIEQQLAALSASREGAIEQPPAAPAEDGEVPAG